MSVVLCLPVFMCVYVCVCVCVCAHQCISLFLIVRKKEKNYRQWILSEIVFVSFT